MTYIITSSHWQLYPDTSQKSLSCFMLLQRKTHGKTVFEQCNNSHINLMINNIFSFLSNGHLRADVGHQKNYMYYKFWQISAYNQICSSGSTQVERNLAPLNGFRAHRLLIHVFVLERTALPRIYSILVNVQLRISCILLRRRWASSAFQISS